MYHIHLYVKLGLNFFKDDFISMKIEPKMCMNMPNEWSQKASSFLTNGCVVLFDGLDCKGDDEPQIFSSFQNTYFSKPDDIPNYNFSGTK